MLLRRKGYFLRRTIIVGVNDEGKILAEQLSEVTHSGCEILGFVGVSTTGASSVNGFKVLGDLHQLDKILAELHVEELNLDNQRTDSRSDIYCV